MKINLNLPNQLTLGRLGLSVLFVGVLSFNWGYGGVSALVIFVVASLTDWLDGWIARTYNLVTDLGKLLDPLADKILVCAAFVGLLDQTSSDFDGPPMWMVVVIISREFLITGLRLVAANRGYVMAADWAGKHKTISQMVYVLVSLVVVSGMELGLDSETCPGLFPLFSFLKFLQPFLLWIALFITVASGCYYFFKNRFLFATETDIQSTPPVSIAPSDELPPVIAPPSVRSQKLPAEPLSSAGLSPVPVGFPAFKEWQVIVAALGKGEQSIILRKGGLAEGRSGFQVQYKQFWLFPTAYHQQIEKTKPAATSFIEDQKEDGPVTLRYYGQITQVGYLHDWDTVLKLDTFHLWKEEVIRERFDWGAEKGLHCIIIRVHRILNPVILDWKPEFAGCKSWVEVPADFSTMESIPVLGDEAYASLRSKIIQTVNL